jgi:ROK family
VSVIGVDLGGTKVAVARLDGRELGASLVQPTDRSGAAGLLAQVAAMVQSVRGDELEAVGIGVPSVVDFETGRVVSSVNVPLGDLPLRDLLAERLGAPVYVDNDATVAAFAEAHDDQLRLVAGNLVMITIATGSAVDSCSVVESTAVGPAARASSDTRSREWTLPLRSPRRSASRSPGRSSVSPQDRHSAALPSRLRPPTPNPRSGGAGPVPGPSSEPTWCRPRRLGMRRRCASSSCGASGLGSASLTRSTPSIPTRS